jgi:hypothetical protein
MKIIHYVYELKNPHTGEFYIGVRSFDGNSLDDTYMGSMSNWDIDKSILIKTVIDDTFKTRKEANEKEIELLIEYINNPLNRNYHIPSVGFCVLGLKRSDEYKSKLSEIKKNQYKLNPHLSIKNKEIQKKRWDDNLKAEWSIKMKNINSTKKYREKQIQSAKNKQKAVLQFDKNGDLIKEFESIHQAARELNIDKTCISRNCNGKYKSAFGYIWKFKNP